jgi:hypothetical protein
LKALGSAIAAAILSAALTGTSAAQTLVPEAYIPTMTVHLKGLAALRATALACAADAVPATEAEDWQRAEDTIVASLWASNWPAGFVNSVPDLMAAPEATPDCTDEALVSDARQWVDGWTASLESLFRDLEIQMVATPPRAGDWEEISAAFDAEIPAQARLFACTAEVMPIRLSLAVSTWNRQLLDLGRKLVVAGYPRDAVIANLDAADTNAIWHPATPEESVALKQSCNADQDWLERFYKFQFYVLTEKVDGVLARNAPAQ